MRWFGGSAAVALGGYEFGSYRSRFTFVTQLAQPGGNVTRVFAYNSLQRIPNQITAKGLVLRR